MSGVEFRRIRMVLATLFIAAWSSFPPNCLGQTQPRVLVLTGSTIYPSPEHAAVREGVVVVRDGRIAAVGPRGSVAVPDGAEVLDCTGLSITAVFWNSHVHFGERKWERAEKLPAAEASEQLREMLTRYGFTRVFDTGSPLANTRALRARIEAGEVEGPGIFTTGDILWPKGGLPSGPVMLALGFIPEPQRDAGVGELRAFVRAAGRCCSAPTWATCWTTIPARSTR